MILKNVLEPVNNIPFSLIIKAVADDKIEDIKVKHIQSEINSIKSFELYNSILLIPVKVYTLFRTKLDSYFDVDF